MQNLKKKIVGALGAVALAGGLAVTAAAAPALAYEGHSGSKACPGGAGVVAVWAVAEQSAGKATYLSASGNGGGSWTTREYYNDGYKQYTSSFTSALWETYAFGFTSSQGASCV